MKYKIEYWVMEHLFEDTILLRTYDKPEDAVNFLANFRKYLKPTMEDNYDFDATYYSIKLHYEPINDYKIFKNKAREKQDNYEKKLKNIENFFSDIGNLCNVERFTKENK